MASISGIYSSSPTLKLRKQTPRLCNLIGKELGAFLTRLKFPTDRSLNLVSTQSLAREIPVELATSKDGAIVKEKRGLEKAPDSLWKRYVDWLYQHKELGLYLDVSRVGFTDKFVQQMEPRFQKAFRAMEELEKGAIANPDQKKPER